MTGPDGREREVDRDKKQRAKEDVSMLAQTVPDLTAPQDPAQRTAARQQTTVATPPKQQGKDEAQPLGEKGAESHAPQTETEAEDKDKGQGHVGRYLKDGDDHRRPRVLHADKPSGQDALTEHGGKAKDDKRIIDPRQAGDNCRGANEAQGKVEKRAAKNEEGHGKEKGENKGALEDGHHASITAPAEGLRRLATGRHAQESEKPIDDIEHHRTHSHGSDERRGTEMTDNGLVNKAKQRHRHIAQNGRQGETKDGGADIVQDR